MTPGETLTEMPPDRPVRLQNEACVYCGKEMDVDETTKEHVIGRRFVPKGKLEGQWNLIVNACRACNSRKSDLENDISAITMQPDLTGKHAHDDEAAALDAVRKAERAFSRRTKKAVKDSLEHMTFKVPAGPNASFTFNFTSPAQIDDDRVYELARLQPTAFFYWITFDQESGRGRYWRGGFHPVMSVHRRDWGNPVMRGFADAVANWEPRVAATNAEGFFKILIRRHPGAACWSWALEWNHAVRVIGFFGSTEAARAVFEGIPPLQMQTVRTGANETVRVRTEIPLPESEDRLFVV